MFRARQPEVEATRLHTFAEPQVSVPTTGCHRRAGAPPEQWFLLATFATFAGPWSPASGRTSGPGLPLDPLAWLVGPWTPEAGRLSDQR